MTSSRESDKGRQRLVTTLAELSVVASTVVALISIFGNDRVFIIAVGLPVLFFGAAIVFLIRRLYSVVTTTVTIAVGGLQGVGKTVFINVLCNQLTEGRSGVLSFVPETRTAQRVFRAVGYIQRGRWPSTTGSDRIDYYRGTVGYVRKSVLSILANGRQEFKIEIGDSAGENWEKLADEAVGEAIDRTEDEDMSPVPRLIDSSFFTYVGESDSLFYLIDTGLFWKSHSMVSESVDDVLSTITLLRTVEGRGPGSRLERPISIVLAKIDLMDTKDRQVLERFISSDSYFPSDQYAPDAEFVFSLRHIDRLREVLANQVANCQFFMVSSLAAIQAARVTDAVDEDLKSGRYSTELPLEWTFSTLRRLRLFRARIKATW